MNGALCSYESGWYLKFFIDACHSGSCKDKAEEWINEIGGNVRCITKNKSEAGLFYLDRDAYVRL